MSPRRRRLRLATLLLSPLFGLLLAEGCLRLVHARGGLTGWLYMAGARTRYDEVEDLAQLIERSGTPYRPLGYSNDFILNSRGLRTSEYSVEKAPGTLRVVVLGDSHSWASGGLAFGDMWHSRLAADLDQAFDEPVELINLGMPAVGTDFELRMWQLEGRRLDADLVILAFSVGNNFQAVRGELADQGVVDRLARRSYLFRLARNAMRVQDAVGDDGSAEAASAPVGGIVREGIRVRYDRDRPKYGVSTHHDIIRRRLVIGDLSRKSTRRFEEACARVESLLAELFTDVRRLGAQPVLVLIPDEHQLDAALRGILIEQLGRDPAEFDVERPQRSLHEICTRLDVPCIDALEPLRERSRERSMFNMRETHLNDLGHAVLADLARRTIVTQQLLGGD